MQVGTRTIPRSLPRHDSVLGDRHPVPRCLILSMLLLLFLGLVAGNAAANTNTDVQKVPVNSVGSIGPGQRFAIADLDGDVRPDLATIQAGSSTSGTMDYWIQLRLTTASRQQSIRLVAPAGGLWIEARDVNGDHAIDLIFSTAWLRRPVAILLNDGHGSFSRIEPATFPKAFSECKTNWSPTSKQAIDSIGFPAQSSTWGHPQVRLRNPEPKVRLNSRSNWAFVFNHSLLPHSGRAPPTRT